MIALARPLGPKAFLVAGVSLAALKVALDLLVARAFGHPFSLSFYFDPADSPLLSPPHGIDSHGAAVDETGYWLTVVGCSIPFLAAGMTLTARRLRDAGMKGYLAIFFLLPFMKFLFFAVLSVAPTRNTSRTVVDEAGPFRSAEIDLGPAPVRAPGRGLALLTGTLAGNAVALSALGISIGLLRNYGWPLMMATPVVAAFVATTVYCRMHRPTGWGATLVTFTTLAVGVTFLGLAAVEGFGCIVMSMPLVMLEALVGTLLAFNLAKTVTLPSHAVGSGLLMLPLAFAANGVSPEPPELAQPIESAIVVHAPPDVVWKRVIAFPPLAPPTELVFRAGIAAPLSATIDGEGPGAVRRCEFTTGAFVEPIDVWNPGRELSFHVTSQPDPMIEQTLYSGPRPPHLDGYLESTRGQFVLEPLADGSTRLVGRTWYRVHMEPERYWRLWGDRVIHTIHMRVLAHVAKLAEDDARNAPSGK